MKINEYFGNYKENNLNQLISYMEKLDNKLDKYYNFGKPFFKGEYKLKYGEFLEQKKLNKNSLTSEDVFNYIAPYFKNIPNWNNPGTMINVIPPVNLISLAVSNIASMYNPNFAQDTYAGMLITSEMEVSKYLSNLVGWNWKHTHGVFTFGGKGTNLYATKIAINKADPNVKNNGCERNKYFMLTSKNGHPCHYEVCNWLGIGISNCYEIECDKNGQMDINQAREIIEKNIENGKTFLGFNLTAGSTNELYVDPIKKVYDLNKEIILKYKLNYVPHIHADAVLGWVYLFFNTYDFRKNPLLIEKDNLKKIKSLNKKVKELKYADSIGVDFHKTGFCPYTSSIVLFKNKEDYFTLDSKDNIPIEELEYGNYNPYHTTLELTRSSNGPLTSLCTLKSLGIEGFQKIISKMFSTTEYFRKKIAQDKRICLINSETEGLASLFIIKPTKYITLSLDEILKLPPEEITEIRNYKVNYGKYILEQSKNGYISFTYTSSRSYVVPGTNVKIGTLKAYPMSVFLNYEEIDRILKEIDTSINSYSQIDNKKFDNKISISDNMVYREKK